MTEFPVTRPLERPPTHPGELFREILEEHLRLSVSEAARRMKISRQSLHAVLAGDAAVSAEMALRFARLTGGDPGLYLEMQDRRDLWLAAKRLGPALAEIEPAASVAP
jgi:addiction module HigA family antidote